MWMQGPEPQSSSRAASALNCSELNLQSTVSCFKRKSGRENERTKEKKGRREKISSVWSLSTLVCMKPSFQAQEAHKHTGESNVLAPPTKFLGLRDLGSPTHSYPESGSQRSSQGVIP